MSSEQRLTELGIQLPHPPTPLGAYVRAVQSGKLLFLSGMLPLEGGALKFKGRLGSDLSVEDGRRAARLATLNALAAAREHLGSLDKVTHVVRLAVSQLTTPEFEDHAKVADGASEVLVDIFGEDKMSTRMVSGLPSTPKGTPVIVELVLEVGA